MNFPDFFSGFVSIFMNFKQCHTDDAEISADENAYDYSYPKHVVSLLPAFLF